MPAHEPPDDTAVAAPGEAARPAPWVADVVLALAVPAVLAAAATAAGDTVPDDAPPPGDVAVAVVAVGFGALLLLRRRVPVAVLLATVAAAIAASALDYPWGAALPAVGALGSAAARGRTRWAVGGGAVLVVADVVLQISRGRAPDGTGPAAGALLTDVALMTAAIALGAVVRLSARAREHAAARHATGADPPAGAAHDRLQAERLRLAADLHDVVAHHLNVVALHTGVATEAVGRDDDAARTALRHVREATAATLHELRATSRVLRDAPSTAPSGGSSGGSSGAPPGAEADGAPGRRARDTLPAITGPVGLSLLVAPARTAGLEVNTWVDVPAGSIDAIVDAAAYRIVQEALTNVLRHADAGHAVVRLVVADGRLRVTVSDDGRGTRRETSAGTGIAAMRERAALLGGTLVARPRDAGGFGVVADLPTRLAEADAGAAVRPTPT